MIGEVITPGYEFMYSGQDFNHVLYVRPLTPTPIPKDCVEVSDALRHDLTKRGHYYQIYPDESVEELEVLAFNAKHGGLNFRARLKP